MTKHASLFAAAALCGLGLLSRPATAQGNPQVNPMTDTQTSASTRDLFRFQRDDTAPHGATRVSINANRVSARPLSPDIFGNFIENLGTVIYDILWADLLHNPNLERTEASNGEAPWWDQTGAATWQEADGSGYLSERCERLSGPDGTFSQRVFLPVYRVRGYTLTLWTRAVEAPGTVTVAVRVGGETEGPFHPGLEKAGKALIQSTLIVTGGVWQKQTVHWTLPAGSVEKGQAGRFVVAYTGGGAVDVDQLRLVPDDAVDGMDPEALKLAKAWNIPVLRLAGNYSSGYRWKEGIGPIEARPTRRNVAWGGVDSHAFGTDEFLDLCRLVGAVPQIGVNAGDGTPEEAASWVSYCNAKSLRVPLWEIGNELYGDWQIGHTDAAGNAERYVRFRKAMLQADPRITLMATGRGDEFREDGMARGKEWNLAVLKAAVAEGGPPPAYLTIHPLVPLPGDLKDRPYAEIYESAMSHPAFLDQTEIPALIDQIQSVEGAGAVTRIAPTEWGIILGGDSWRQGPNHDVEAGAIFSALTLNAFLRHSDWVTLANTTALLHGGCIKKSRGVLYVTPQYYAQQMLADAAPSLAVETQWSGPAVDVPARGFLPAVPAVSDVDVFSALTADKQNLVVFLVNRKQADSRPVHLDLSGFAASKAAATILTADDPQASNGWDHPNVVAPKPFPLPAVAAGGMDITLPPHSILALTFSR